MISIRRISLGGGFRYLMESVAAGDTGSRPTDGLAAYYAASGTPPGVFLGAGLGDLDGGRGVKAGSRVSEEHLRRMLGTMCDPISGDPVGHTPILSETRVPVAGFDLTFSPPKSVSVAWALGDEDTKTVIYGCHRRAVQFVLAYAEREVFHSRSGTKGIVEEDVTGVVATAFTHWDSRTGDPQLHDHVVVWNRARSVSDGRWRTLDSRGLFKATVMLSELHQGVLSDLLTERLGVGWEGRARRHSERPRFEITGVPETLMGEFSRRAEQVEVRTQTLAGRFVDAYGRQPTATEAIQLRQQATLQTRPAKTHRSLGAMTARWRHRAEPHVGAEAEQVAWVASLAGRNDLPLLHAGDLAQPILADAAGAALDAVAGRRATFSRYNIAAEAHRILHGVRFATPDERVAVVEQVTDLALDRSLALTPPALQHTPQRYVRADGSDRLHPQSRHLYTTETLLEAEARLLAAGRRTDGPMVAVDTVAAVADRHPAGGERRLSTDQALAVQKVATSGRRLDVLVGPAGTGKSTAMAGLRACWEAQHGPGSVIGLAPSAAAAEALAAELGVGCENTTKWLTEWRRLPDLIARRQRLAATIAAQSSAPAAGQRGRQRLGDLDRAIAQRSLHPGQLVIVDEASLAGTLALDELVSAAGAAGAKILLVGDWAQLSAVEAGGAFGLVARDRGNLAPQLGQVRRFTNPWEADASLQLRHGHPGAVDSYQAHGRIIEGDRDSLLDGLYTAWKHDVDAGRSSLMIAADTATVAELNRRARADRVASGAVADEGVAVAGSQTAGVGDVVVTRQNERRLTTGRRWVKNGDRWTVTATGKDGSLTVRRAESAAGEVVLPADYVTDHVELAYATTAFQCQGRTVDTTHALISPTATRELLYVAATRGRDSNMLYVDTCYDPDPATGHDQLTEAASAREVLGRVLANREADLSADETMRQAQHDAESFATLAAEYQTIAQAAQADRWNALLEQCGLNAHQLAAVRVSDAFGPLLTALRDADARGLDVEATFPRLVQAGSLHDARDIAAVLHGRVDRWVEEAGGGQPLHSLHLIAGLVPQACGVTDPDMVQALHEREQAMEIRARHIVEHAIAEGATWVRQLGDVPVDPIRREAWTRAASTVAAYRDGWDVDASGTVDGERITIADGDPDLSSDRAAHRQLARTALAQALALSDRGSTALCPGQASDPTIDEPRQSVDL